MRGVSVELSAISGQQRRRTQRSFLEKVAMPLFRQSLTFRSFVENRGTPAGKASDPGDDEKCVRAALCADERRAVEIAEHDICL